MVSQDVCLSTLTSTTSGLPQRPRGRSSPSISCASWLASTGAGESTRRRYAGRHHARCAHRRHCRDSARPRRREAGRARGAGFLRRSPRRLAARPSILRAAGHQSHARPRGGPPGAGTVNSSTPFRGRYNLTLSEAFDIAADDGQVLREVVARECAAQGGDCAAIGIDIRTEARTQAAYYETLGRVQLRGVNLLMESLATVGERKTVVLLSGGMPSSDRIGGRPSLAESMLTIGAEAGTAMPTCTSFMWTTAFSTQAGRRWDRRRIRRLARPRCGTATC